MGERTIAKRYAQALFEIAMERGELEETSRGLDLFASTAMAIPRFAAAVHNEETPLEKRIYLVEKTCELCCGSLLTCDFLKLLIRKGRLELISHIVEIFHDLKARAQNISQVRAVVADPLLKEETLSRIESMFKEQLSATVSCKCEVDERIVGGVVLAIGDRVLDASVRGRLDRLRETLLR